MEPWTRMEFQALALTVALRSVAHADDDDWEKRFKFSYDFPSLSLGKPKAESPFDSWPPPTPRWFIASVVCMVVFFVTAVLAFCFCHFRRRRMLMAQMTLVPPPLAPATLGAERYGFPGQQPTVSGAMMPPSVGCPPVQRCSQPQAMPYTQVPLYAAQNVDSLQRPSAPSPLAQLDAPPPYNSESIYKQ